MVRIMFSWLIDEVTGTQTGFSIAITVPGGMLSMEVDLDEVSQMGEEIRNKLLFINFFANVLDCGEALLYGRRRPRQRCIQCTL